MVDRIKALILKQKMTAAQFASEIEVQRSAVSHLLSGRNKPSLDFVLKIKKRFPHVSLEWLLFGEGKMQKSVEEKETDRVKLQPDLFQTDPDLVIPGKKQLKSAISEPGISVNLLQSDEKPAFGKLANENVQSPIQVIAIYPDDTFKIYNPR